MKYGIPEFCLEVLVLCVQDMTICRDKGFISGLSFLVSTSVGGSQNKCGNINRESDERLTATTEKHGSQLVRCSLRTRPWRRTYVPWGYSIDSFRVILFALRACSMLSHVATLASALSTPSRCDLRNCTSETYVSASEGPAEYTLSQR